MYGLAIHKTKEHTDSIYQFIYLITYSGIKNNIKNVNSFYTVISFYIKFCLFFLKKFHCLNSTHPNT